MNTDLHGFLSEEQKARYRRQLVLPEIGEKGQLLLRKSMVVGLGGLGSISAKYGIVHGEMLAVETPRGSIRIMANVTQDIKPGVVSVPHGWAEANCNILLDAKLLDHVSGYITMNSVACRIVKLAN